MTLSTVQIRRKQPSTKRTVESVQEGSGCYLITEPLPLNSKRFILRMRFPFNKNGRLVDVPLGSWGKDITTVQQVIHDSEKIKRWSRFNNRNPQEYKSRNDKKNIDKTLSEVFDSYMEIHKQKTKKVTWEVTLNRLNQMLDFFGKDKRLSDFELRNGGRQLVIEMIKPMIKRGSVEQSSRCRRLLGQVFNHCEDRGWMEYGQNPSSRKTDEETIKRKKRSNPTLNWKEVPQFLKVVSENPCEGSILTDLSTKFYLLSCLRVGTLVSLKWDWFDSEENLWRIPPETSGLKRKMGEGEEHLLPVSPEMRMLMNELFEINGCYEYVFYSQNGKNHPHLNRETINNHITNLGYKGRLTSHGWRDVIVTSGQEELKFPLDIILRQIGHTEHKQGTSGHYDNTEFLPERREFINKWSLKLINNGLKI